MILEPGAEVRLRSSGARYRSTLIGRGGQGAVFQVSAADDPLRSRSSGTGRLRRPAASTRGSSG